MKSWKQLHVALLLILSVAVARTQTDTVTFIHVNDTHSNLSPIGPRTPALDGTLGGIARAATLIGTLEMTKPNPVFVHAGDLFIGDVYFNAYFGVPEFRILSSLGCKAMTVGNHEFDLGPSTLLQALDTAFAAGGAFPLLSANTLLDDPAVQPLRKYISSFTIETFGSTKVGIFGLTTPATMLISQPLPAVVDTPFSYAAAMVESLSVRGCTIIVCLSHLGLALDEMLASMVPGIHLIIGGHDHYALTKAIPVQNPLGDTTWIVQANAFYLNVGMTQMVRSGSSVRLLQYTLLNVDSTIAKDPTVDGIVASLNADIESKFGPFFTGQVGSSTGFFKEVADSLLFNGSRDTPIGNLVTDAFRALTGTRIAIEPGGSTAQPIYAGPLVADDIFRVVGYGFNLDNGLGYHLVRFTLTGAGILAGLEFGLSAIEQDDEYLLQASGMEYSYNPLAPVGSRVAAVTVNGVPLHPDSSYSVSANFFLKSFLDYLQIPYTGYHEFGGDTTEFKALLDYIVAHSPISPSSSGRILSPVKETNRGEVPKQFRLEQNFPNPFNPMTTIGFDIPTACDASLKVYSIVGQEVATLVQSHVGPGRHMVHFDGTRFASGVYLYCLIAGSYSSVKKLLLLK